MSSVYIIAAAKNSMKPGQRSIVLKLPASRQVKKTYRMLKKQLPEARLGFFGFSGDKSSDQQEQTAPHSRVVYAVADFIQAVRSGGEASSFSRSV